MEKGMKTYDLDGTQIDPLDLAKKHGVNAKRLRIWHTPEMCLSPVDTAA